MLNERFAHSLNAFEEFWERKPRKRVVLNLPVAIGPAYRAPNSLEEKWLDEEYILARTLHSLNNTYYAAESFPHLFTNLGPGCLPACIGGSYMLAERTIWYDTKQIIDDWENPPQVKFDENSEIWQHVTRMQNKFFTTNEVNTTIVDIGGVMDTVAALRGTENLLYDLYDYPEQVKEFTNRVTKEWFKAFDRQIEAISKTGQPYNNWMNIPSSKPWYPIQCDFSAMISPAQFEEFVLPHLVEQSEHMERCIYHLDGPGEIPHLDMLLDVPGITGIQWVAGDGQASLFDEQWFPLYKKIQDKNKNIVLLCPSKYPDLESAEKLIKTLEPTGVYIAIGLDTKDEAENFIQLVDKWSC